MIGSRPFRAVGVSVLIALMAVPAAAQQSVVGRGGTQLDLQLLRPSGGPVVPFFEGWYQNPNGTYDLVFGYFSVNTEEAVEIPLGPDNSVQPVQFDGAQPTHFQPIPPGDRRHWGVFTVTVPADFGEQDVVWTLRNRGQSYSVPGRITRVAYELDGWDQPGRLTVAPRVRFGADGPEGIGFKGVTIGPLEARVGTPLPLEVWAQRDNPHVEEDSAPVNLRWIKHQGAGAVAFSEPQSAVPTGGGYATTQVSFSEPGEYVVRVLAYDSVGDFEFYCCWTNGFVRVQVTQ